MQIKRGIIQSFSPHSYTASVLLLEATCAALSAVTVANQLDSCSMLPGALCAVLFFDEHNSQDAVIIATFANGSTGLPTPPPGRLTLITGVRQINADTISSGTSTVYTLTGGSSGIPSGASGILFKAYFTSSTAGAYIQLLPHGASDSTAYASIGNLPSSGSSCNGGGLLAMDAAGRIDIRAQSGTCVVTLYTYGYIQ